MKHFTVYTTAGCFPLVARTPAEAIASALKLVGAKRHAEAFQVIACVQEHAFEKIAKITEMTVDLSMEDFLTLCKEQPGRLQYLPTAFESYFEFIVRDADGCVQAQGTVRNYGQVLSEGQRYLAQYQQDGPHSLEVRRVDVLFPAGAAPTAEPAPTGKDSLQVALPAEGEVAELVEFLRIYGDYVMDEYGDVGEHDQLTRAADLLEQRHPAPVPVSERPWEREEWCNQQGQCWFGWHRAAHVVNPAMWMLCSPDVRDFLFHQVCLPAHALPLPAAEEEQRHPTPVPVLPEDAQVIEPATRTILAAQAVMEAAHTAWAAEDAPLPIAAAALRAAALQMVRTDDLGDTAEDIFRGAERSHQAGWLHRIATELRGQK